MVGTDEFLEGQYVTVDLVKNSPSRKCVIVGEPRGEETDFGYKLTANVNMDGKEKIWRMNKDSIQNMRELAKDTKEWDGAKVSLRLIVYKGKESVVGLPELKAPSEEKISD